jgi:hypothetical protein
MELASDPARRRADAASASGNSTIPWLASGMQSLTNAKDA